VRSITAVEEGRRREGRFQTDLGLMIGDRPCQARRCTKELDSSRR
jgi:hypothetical protein